MFKEFKSVSKMTMKSTFKNKDEFEQNFQKTQKLFTVQIIQTYEQDDIGIKNEKKNFKSKTYNSNNYLCKAKERFHFISMIKMKIRTTKSNHHYFLKCKK